MSTPPIGSNVPSTSTPQSGDVGGSPDVDKTMSQPAPSGGQAPASQPPANAQQQTQGAKNYAAAKMMDSQLSLHARGLTQPRTKEQQIKNIGEQAKILGLEKGEITKLTDRLKGMNDAEFKSECAFLNKNVLGVDGNSDRALRTYVELKSLQDVNPQRLTDDHIHTLTRGVAEARDKWGKGWEGVLGQDNALKAATALVTMPKPDYDAINKALRETGKGADGKPAPGSDPQMEKALILKAAGIRIREYSNPTAKDHVATLAGKPTESTATVEQFAKDIRGTQRGVLAQQSTAIDPYAGDKALQQRWNDSCGPTTTQAMRAELDPVYARQLHQEFIHDTNPTGKIADEQKTNLQNHGGIAVPRGTHGGAGTSLDDVLNTVCTMYTGVRYSAKPAGDTVRERNATLDKVEGMLKRGIDVPIRAQWSGGGGHFMILTDVRGHGKDQLFLVTDPWKGQTSWISREQLASGKTPFTAGTGKLTHIY